MKKSKSKSICLIPARGGSKRIKNKNIKKFFGKPLLSRVIKILRKSNIFDDIFVSTDSIKIKKIAEKSGAVVPYLRSKKLSDDNAIIKDVINDFINNEVKKNRKQIIYLLFIQLQFSSIKKFY